MNDINQYIVLESLSATVEQQILLRKSQNSLKIEIIVSLSMQSCEKLSVARSDKLEVIVFCMTLSVSNIIVDDFWPFSFYTQLSYGPATAFQSG